MPFRRVPYYVVMCFTVATQGTNDVDCGQGKCFAAAQAAGELERRSSLPD
jgi:hypothetical protein